MAPLRERSNIAESRQHPYKPSKLLDGASNDIENKTTGGGALKAPLGPPFWALREGVLTPMNLAAVQAEAEAQAQAQAQEYEDDDDDDDGPFKWNCNQIRTKINRLIRSGEMKVTHFQKSLNINSNSYGRFMRLTGPFGGIDNQTYFAAHRFFAKREKAGVKAPKVNRAAIASAQDEFNVNGITLEGESELDVEVYDTCDDVRKKIRAHLQKPGVTAAGFLRDIVKTYHANGDPNRKIQSVQLNNFLGQKGALCGNKSAVYYAAYIFFEKLRIKTGKPKSDKREQLEEIYYSGMDRQTNFGTQKYIVSAGRIPVTDDLGRCRTIPDPSLG